MMIRKGLLAGAMALTLAGGAAYANSSTMPSTQSNLSHQTTGQSTSSASQINLTQQQKKELFQAASRMPQQNASGPLEPGSKVPSSVKLSAVPSSAKQELGSALQNSEIARLQNGDVIVANPSDKTVQAVITPQDANATTGQGSSSTSPSSSSPMSSPSTSPSKKY
jgi:hypothetical protein